MTAPHAPHADLTAPQPQAGELLAHSVLSPADCPHAHPVAWEGPAAGVRWCPDCNHVWRWA